MGYADVIVVIQKKHVWPLMRPRSSGILAKESILARFQITLIGLADPRPSASRRVICKARNVEAKGDRRRLVAPSSLRRHNRTPLSFESPPLTWPFHSHFRHGAISHSAKWVCRGGRYFPLFLWRGLPLLYDMRGPKCKSGRREKIEQNLSSRFPRAQNSAAKKRSQFSRN